MRLRTWVAVALLVLCSSAGADPRQSTEANRVTELTFTSGKDYHDPFNEVDLDVVFTSPAGAEVHVPAFWQGSPVQWSIVFSQFAPA